MIPSGYGAGIVLLWDRGTWVPEVDDVEAALKKGDLKLTLNGFKLKGSWVLVRTKGKWAGGSDRSWLLIKHRDEWAGDVDIAEFAPLSVKSGGDFADILAQDQPEIWQSHRPAQGGEAGALFQGIVRKALELKSSGGSTGAGGRVAPVAKNSGASRRSAGSKSSSAGSKSSAATADANPGVRKAGSVAKKAAKQAVARKRPRAARKRTS